MSRVLLVRHGETTWNREGRVQGWARTALTGRGREQARATRTRLATADVDRLVVSDLQRTRETARLLTGDDGTRRDGERDSGDGTGRRSGRSGLDAPCEYDRGWRERDFGDYQGLERSTIARRRDDFDADASLTALPDVPGGESRDAFVERVRDAWASLVDGLDGTVVVVTHGGPVRAVVADVEDVTFERLAREWSPANCGITAVDPDAGRVVSRDDTDHLA